MSTAGIEDLVLAILGSDVETVQAMLQTDPSLAMRRVDGNPRSMLHYATDWPAKRPRVGEMIQLLVAAGADVSAGAKHPDNPTVAETPLHWAVSANDVEAASALLDAGADVNAPGGIFDGCTPFEEAIIFNQLAAAQLVLDHGAKNYLAGAAALGHHDQVESFFDAEGDLDLEATRLPNWPPLTSAQMVIDRAFQFACRSGHIEIARFLLGRGADPTAVSPATTTALDMATEHGHVEVIAWLKRALRKDI